MRSVELLGFITLAMVVACGTDSKSSDTGGAAGLGVNTGGVGPVAGTGGPAAGTGGPAAGTGGPAAGTGGPAAGTGAAGVGAAAGMGGGAGEGAVDDGLAGWTSSKGMCDLNTGQIGDEACLLPPPAGEGFQIHVGPPDHNNVGQWAVSPGEENSVCWGQKTPNPEKVFYQGWELSGRPGTHHIINTMHTSAPGGWSSCLDGGTGTASTIIANLPGASQPYMPRGPVAPENKTIGSSVPASTDFQADMHYFNFGGDTLLREFWINLWYAPTDVTVEEANQIRGMGGLSWLVVPIAPGTDTVYKYSCPINAAGRIIQLLGHTHAHGVRETAWINRGKPTELKIFEQFDYLEPQIFYFNSVTTNPEFAPGVPGAVSGSIDVNAGDTFDWECHVINDSSAFLSYTNEVETGEMCNMWGSSVGPKIDCLK